MQAGEFRLAFGRREVGVAVLEFLRSDEGDFAAEVRVKVGEGPSEFVAGIANGGHDAANGVLQVVERTIFA